MSNTPRRLGSVRPHGGFIVRVAFVATLVTLSDKTRIKTLTITPSEGARPKLDCLQSLVNLESLDLSSNGFDETDLAPVSNLRKLKNLSLFANDVGTRVIADVVRKLPAVEALDLRRTSITNAAFPYLAEMKNLKRLSLGSTRVASANGPRRRESLAVLAALPQLEELELSFLLLEREDILSLKHIKSLRQLHLDDDIEGLKPDVFATLKKDLPTVPLARYYLRSRLVREIEFDRKGRLVHVGLCHPVEIRTILEMNEAAELRSIAVDRKSAISLTAQFGALKELRIVACEIADTDLRVISAIPKLESLTFEKCKLDFTSDAWNSHFGKNLSVTEIELIESSVSDELRKLLESKARVKKSQD